MNTEPRLDAPPPDSSAVPLLSGAEPQPAARPFGAFHWALALAVLALALLAWQWLDTRNQMGVLQQELARRLAEADTTAKESRTLSEQSRESAKEALAKLTLLESKLSESQNQQIALEALYKELARNRDEWWLAEVEQILLIASQQLQLAGNVKAALIALQTADGRLQRTEKPQLAPIRKAIDKDIERLKALPYLDVVGMSVRLDNLAATVAALPLAMELRPQQAPAPGPQPAAGTWARIWREAWHDFKQLVRIENMEKLAVPLLAPDQAFFLRENLRLRLLSARLALLARDEQSLKTDLQAVQDWLNRFYDTKDKAVANVQASLRQLQEAGANVDLSDSFESLTALRNYKLVQERSEP